MYAYCSRSGGFWQVAETRGWQTALPIARKSEVTYNWCILSYVLKGYFIFMEIEGPSNKFQGECAIRLSSQNENTVVSYQGNLQLGRGNVLIPAPLVKATIRVLLQQFFANLTDQLRSSTEGFTDVTTLEEMYESPFLSEEIGEPLQSMNMPTPPT